MVLYFGVNVNGYQRIDVVGNPNIMVWLEPYHGDRLYGWFGQQTRTLFVPRLLALPAGG